MSTYHMANGMNSAVERLLDAIGLNVDDIDRFRDIWIDRDFRVITVHARIGGGNRQFHEDCIASLRSRPLYLGDEDDGYDGTYANFRFSVLPEERDKLLAEIAEANLSPELHEKLMQEITKDSQTKWTETFTALRKLK